MMEGIVERDFTEEEKIALVNHIKWVACPMCDGKPPIEEPGAFCVLCGNEGKVTNSTRDVTAHLRLSFISQIAQIQSLQADKAALRERIALLEGQQLSTLSGFYAHQPVAVAKICDEVLDRSGALLGKVRDHYCETRALIGKEQS